MTAAAWLDVAAVRDHLGVEPTAPAAASVDRAAAAAAAYVARVRPDLFGPGVATPPSSPADVPGDVVLGAILLAARLHARKSSPAGIASYAEFGPAAIVRTDQDVAQLLGLGRFGRPVIG